VVLPAYNQGSFIEDTTKRVIETLASITPDYEVIIAEDGSTDDTYEQALKISKKFKKVIVEHSGERLGRGKALKRAFERSRGEILVYMDVDLATDLKHLHEIVESIDSGYDVATGSRMLHESDAPRNFKRGFASRVYNWMVRTFLRSKLRDHQCGFKAFRRESLMELLVELKDEHWFWDTELLVRAQRSGYRVIEIPVKWRHGGATTVDFGRDVAGMGSKILGMWYKEGVKPRLKKWSTPLTILFTFAFLSVIAYMIYRDWDSVSSGIIGADYVLFLAASIFYTASWPIRGARYNSILKKLGYRLGLNFVTGSIFLSQSANVILPARIGDLVRAYILKTKRDVPLTSGFSSLVVERVFDVFSITIIGFIAAIYTLNLIDLPSIYLLALAICAVLVFVVFVFLIIVRLKARKAGDTSGLGLFRATLYRFVGEISVVSTDARTFTTVSLSSIAIWFTDIITCYIVLIAFNLEPLLPLVILAVTMGNVFKIVPLTPGGIGGYEIIVAGVLVLGGIEWGIALTAAIIDHLIKNLVTLLFGGVYLSLFNMKMKELVARKDAGNR